MKKFNYKIELYQYLSETKGKLFEMAKKIPGQIGMPDNLLGTFGLSGTISECHGLLRKAIADEVEAGQRKVINSGNLDFEIRKLVKSYYGDEYDAVVASTCEALLMVGFDTLFSPPVAGRGENYRARYISPYERHAHHHAGYGRPFPPRYKDIFADRGVTAGEYGFMGKRLNNLDTILVPMVGGRYDCHGLKYHPCQLLSNVDAKATADAIAATAKRHEASISGFTSLGYTNPSYGYGEVDETGVPVLQKEISKIAQQYNVPYVIDNATAIPFQCVDIRKNEADLMMFSMDKSSGGTTCGLAIGKEESIVPMARAMGTAGPRFGGLISH
ncbi:MAG: aminotransferase class V-fold PLP-dependent enzyme, partial [Thermodesulfobacteriota bacterium]